MKCMVNCKLKEWSLFTSHPFIICYYIWDIQILKSTESKTAIRKYISVSPFILKMRTGLPSWLELVGIRK
jgi:hypothetical protein